MTDVPLTRRDAAFVAKEVARGRYPDAQSAVHDALKRLREDAEEAEKEARFEAAIAEGLADLEAGRYETIEPDQIGAWSRRLLEEASRD